MHESLRARTPEARTPEVRTPQAAADPPPSDAAALLAALGAAGVAVVLFDAAGRVRAATPAVQRVLMDDPEWGAVWQAARAAAAEVHAAEGHALGRIGAAPRPPEASEREVETAAHGYRLVVAGAGGGRPAWVAVVLERRGSARPSDAPSPALGELSARERQVARLLAAGQTTVTAAAALGISAHTARRHAERVYSKLGIRSRAALGALLARDAERSAA